MEIDMNITFGILYHFLQKNYQVKTNLTPDSDYVIRKLRIWNGETPEKEVLYLSSSLPDNLHVWTDCCCLFLDKKKDPTGWKGCYIQFPVEEEEPSNMFTAINILNEIMERFNEWMLFRTEGDLSVLLNNFEKMTGWPAIVVDRHLHFIALSRNFSKTAGWFTDQSPSDMPMDFLNTLMTDENFKNAINEEEPFFYSYSETPEASHEIASCYNIRLNGKYKARVLIQTPDNHRYIGQKALTKALAEKAADMMAADRQMLNRIENYEFYQMLKSLLHGQKDRTFDLKERLAVRGWSTEHRYQVMLFSFMEAGNGTVTPDYYEKRIEAIEGDCAAIAADEGICCIRNLSLTTAEEQDIRQMHAVFLRENLCKSASSQIFHNLADLSTYYIEAQIALQLGSSSGRTEWHYQFEDYQLTYLLKSASGLLSPRELLHPAYRILEAYDQEKHARLLETALAYMKSNFNVTKAAELLEIHRTSMLFRLDRIEKLTGFDWNNWKELLHLSLSFALTENRKQ